MGDDINVTGFSSVKTQSEKAYIRY